MRGLVAPDGIGDVCSDVEGGRSGRPVARAFRSVDRAPGKSRTLESQELGSVAGQVQRGVAPAQGIAGGVRRGVGEDRQNERFGVPEGVAVVARPGQPLRRDRAFLAAQTRLQGVKQREARSLLELGVPLDLNVSALPKVVEVGALAGHETIPTGVERLAQGRSDLVAQCRRRTSLRPPVGEELDDAQALTGPELARDRQPRSVLIALALVVGARRSLDDVIHRGRHSQPALARAVHQHGAQVVVDELLGDERRFDARPGAGIVAHMRQRLVGDEL